MSLYKDKTVALIGSAPHLLDLYQAPYINSFDLVVRINTSLPIPGEIKHMTGNRCDILYMNVMKDTILNSKELKRLKQLRVNPDFYTDNNYTIKLNKYQAKLGIEKVKPIGVQWGKGLINFLDGTFPNTGLTAMCEILEQQPKQLYVTGFTFWQSGGHYRGYRNKKYSDKVEKLKGDYEIHKQEPQIKYFMKNIQQSVITDEPLKELIKLWKEL